MNQPPAGPESLGHPESAGHAQDAGHPYDATHQQAAHQQAARQQPAEQQHAARPEPDDLPTAQAMDQIKDLYATAEAIGDENVDRHFDQLLARQRELITEYFNQARTKPDDSAATRVSPE